MKENNEIHEAISFNFNKKLKTILGIAGIVGILALLWSLFIEQAPASRIWANIWLNGLFFLFLGLGALFFWTVNTLGESGWQTSIQRILESMGQTIPFAAILLLLAFPGLTELFEWTHTEHLDEILEKKEAYLNVPFWIARFILYFAIWTWFAFRLRRLSLKNDIEPQTDYLKKLRNTSGLFIVFFAVSSSMSAWDWLMSIDAHWFSTLYGWYTFSSMFVASLSVIILITIVFMHYRILPHINGEHLHDLGKYLFGFSIFWAYLWVSQFLLIWYGNIPEETVYFVERVDHFNTLFFMNVVINFAFPFLALMTRGSKRQPLYLAVIAFVVLAGHWLDLYLAIMPGVVGFEAAKIGVLEIGLPLFYFAVFLAIFFVSFSKAKAVPENHPYFKESFHYENI